MAVVDADHLKAPAPRIVIGVQQLERIDDIAAAASLGRDVLRPTRFERAPRLSFTPDQEAATLLREGFSRMPFDVADGSDWNLDYLRSSQ
jgi:hypothetical protein